MNQTSIFLLVFSLFFCFFSASAVVHNPDSILTGDTINVPDSATYVYSANMEDPTNPISQDSAKTSKYRKKKLVAAILSFPIPFGLLGLHRLFLGTKPYIPFVYIGTLGGCFLIVPIIDFIAILAADEEDFKRFENNPRVFMWSH